MNRVDAAYYKYKSLDGAWTPIRFNNQGWMTPIYEHDGIRGTIKMIYWGGMMRQVVAQFHSLEHPNEGTVVLWDNCIEVATDVEEILQTRFTL